MSRVTCGEFSFEAPAGFSVQTSVQLQRPGDAAVPLSITLNQDAVLDATSPLAYVNDKLEQLSAHLDRFNLIACEETRVGDFPAAKAHFTFVAQLELVQCVLVWFNGKKLLSATASTIKGGADDAWKELQKVAESVKS